MPICSHLNHHVYCNTSHMLGAETWATTRGQEARLEVNEMRMLRWMCGVTRRYKIRNEHIRGATKLQASKKISEKRQKWYGHVRRMKEEHIVRRMLDVDIPDERRGRRNHYLAEWNTRAISLCVLCWMRACCLFSLKSCRDCFC